MAQEYQYQGVPPLGYPQLPPLRVNVLGGQYCLPYPTVLIMKEKASWSMENMDIRDVNGTLHFQLKAKAISLHSKRALFDSMGNPVCCLMKKALSLHSTTYICPGMDYNVDNHIATLKTPLFNILPHIKVHLRGNESGTPDFDIRGSFIEHKFVITDRAGQPIAEVSRKLLSMSSIVLGMDTYLCQIFPGVDMAFVAMLVCAIEEIIVGDGDKSD